MFDSLRGEAEGEIINSHCHLSNTEVMGVSLGNKMFACDVFYVII